MTLEPNVWETKKYLTMYSKEPSAWAEVSLGRLEANVRLLMSRLGSGIKIIAIVKANAYGHGAVAVSEHLQKLAGVEGLGVSRVEEGIELRSAGIHIPIYILEYILPGQEKDIVKYNLIPVVDSISMAENLALEGRLKQKKVKAQIRVNTDSGSMGITIQELPHFLIRTKEMEWLDLSGCFTHLTAAYFQNSQLVAHQLSLFEQALEIAREIGIPYTFVHAASSPGILDYPASYYNMVRPGTLMYGLPSFEGRISEGYKPVMQLKSRIIQVKDLPAGSHIETYNSRDCLTSPIRMAFVPVGYNDAPFLLNLREGEVLIREKRAPILGAPFMMNVRVDVSHIPDAKPGDEVVLFGEQGKEVINAEEVAKKAGITVTKCEFLCMLNCRMPRFYKE